jgi:hypothetical protein
MSRGGKKAWREKKAGKIFVRKNFEKKSGQLIVR